MKTTIENFEAYQDHSGVCALVRVDGILFSAWFTDGIKINVVQNKAQSICPGKRRTAIAEWRFTKELEARTTPEYRAATRALYAQP